MPLYPKYPTLFFVDHRCWFYVPGREKFSLYHYRDRPCQAELSSPGELPDGAFFDLNVPPEKLVLTFNYVPAANDSPGGYFFSEGKYIIPTPEPGTICLIGTGLAAMVGRKRSWRRSTRN